MYGINSAKFIKKGSALGVRIIALVLVVILCAGGFMYKDTIMGLIGFGVQEEANWNNAVQTNNVATNYTPQVLNAQTKQSEILNNSCKNGNLKDCVSLATLYLEGDGVTKDSIRAINILTEICEQKYADACALLADIYDKGIGVAESAHLYLDYANKACDFGNIDACYNLGIKYYRGGNDLIPKDVAKAFFLFKNTCDSGKVEGCNNLAVIYNNGKNGIQKNMKLAKSLFQNACNKGYAPSCENLKKMSF